ncbi:MAG: fliR [Chlamydiales bacterium]|jgi:flagellar biosynthetic protein FliR|nr:fliR [Chlamydiales bacterium]
MNTSLSAETSLTEIVLFLGYLFARVGGMMMLAPFFSHLAISQTVRTFIAVFITVLLAFSLYPAYRLHPTEYGLTEVIAIPQASLLEIALLLLKEIAVGALIGFCFSLVYEAISLAGQLVTTAIGLSFNELLDPASNSVQPTLGHFYMISATMIILILDIHHLYLELFTKSFLIIPLGHYQMPEEMLSHIIIGSARFFPLGLQIAAVPLVVLLLSTLSLGLMSRVMPEMNIFAMSFPFKILVGYFTLGISLKYMPLFVKQSSIEFYNLAEYAIRHIGSS